MTRCCSGVEGVGVIVPDWAVVASEEPRPGRDESSHEAAVDMHVAHSRSALTEEQRTGQGPSDGGHGGHELIAASGRRRSGVLVGYLICTECQVVVGPLPLCGLPTLRGKACRTPIHTDLGYITCWSHGEGRGRTSTPRRAS
jgi:hypothetical protein